MSYDVNVWTTSEPELNTILPERERWRVFDAHFEYEAGTWMIDAGAITVDAEDVPEEVSAVLPGIAWLVELSLSPIGAPKVARAFLVRTAKTIAMQSHGLVEDKQTDELWLPSGVKRYATPSREENVSLLTLSWWVHDESLRDKASLNALVDILKRNLPEAIARRYGDYEPPKFKIAEQGESHFRAFLESTAQDSRVFYTTRPVVGFSLSSDTPPGPSLLGYRANLLTIEVEVSALSQPGWERQLRETWQLISLHLRPFYADVRVIRGWLMSRNGRIWGTGESESHPVLSWWWNGIPRTPPIAAVIGPPYLELWPTIAQRGEFKSGLVFLSTQVWSESTSLDERTWSPPEELADISTFEPARNTTAYPKVFPFAIH